MSLYKNVWRKPFHIPPDAHPGTLVSLTEAAAMLGVNRRTLQRALQRSDGPAQTPGYFVGRQRWFRISDLWLWKARTVGEPKNHVDLWELWSAEAGFAPLRPQPKPRPKWWAIGERRRIAKRRIRSQIKAKVAAIESAMRLADFNTPLAKDAVESLDLFIRQPL